MYGGKYIRVEFAYLRIGAEFVMYNPDALNTWETQRTLVKEDIRNASTVSAGERYIMPIPCFTLVYAEPIGVLPQPLMPS